MPPSLSILDLSLGRTGRPLHEALRETVALAQVADRLGAHRFWVGENHNLGGLAGSAPAPLIATIAESTERVRVGAGCVLLNNHAPLAVAETFRVLHALHPGRIDLGLGRAPGGDPLTVLALRQERAATREDEFLDRLADLLGFADGFPAPHPMHGVLAMPADAGFPELWVLGSGVQSGRTAALAGVRYGFAGHLAPALDRAGEPIAAYRAGFEPIGSAPTPYAAISVLIFCADTTDRAAELADAYAVAWSRHHAGRPGLVPTPEEARAEFGEPGVETARARMRATALIGGPREVAGALLSLAAEHDADELILTTGIHDPQERARCFELIAKEWPR